MRPHLCQWCNSQVTPRETPSGTRKYPKYCSPECKRMAMRKRSFELVAARAAARGLTIEAYKRRSKRDLPIKGAFRMRHPKTYAEIKRANRARKVESGWRGQACIGGGSALHNDAWLKPSEYVRPRDLRDHKGLKG